MKNKYTLMGDTICNKREKLPIFTSEDIAEADLFLYQVYVRVGRKRKEIRI